ncbi:hypothetical protein L7F22_011361 [Adiantum nelumboides]|nr:hypothetical protein [Adiantum nelumboides]
MVKQRAAILKLPALHIAGPINRCRGALCNFDGEDFEERVAQLAVQLPDALHHAELLQAIGGPVGDHVLKGGGGAKVIQELFDDLKVKYDAMESKSQVWIYGGEALVALWFSFIVIWDVNNIPLLPKLLEFVGLCYSGLFVYRYPLFKSSRKHLAANI